MQACKRKGASHCQDACTKLQERGAIIYRNDKLFIKVFSKTLRTCPTNKGACKDKVPFNWGPEHQLAFKLVKNEIITAPILAYYDPKKLTVLQTDASINGLGACLLQDEKPVYFMSKALTEAQ